MQELKVKISAMTFNGFRIGIALSLLLVITAPEGILNLSILTVFTKEAYAVSVGYDEFDYWEPTKIVRVCRRYDSEGRLRQKISYWQDGVTPQQDEKYDLENNMVEKIHYNSSGRMQANVDGWAAMRAKYNDRKPMVESFYGEDGKIVARKLYSESGRLVARQMMGDQDFDPYEQFEAQPVMGERVLYYDRSGQLKGAAGGTRQD